MNDADIICRKEQQIELLNQTTRIESSPKAQLYCEFEARKPAALKLTKADLGLRATLGMSGALSTILPWLCVCPFHPVVSSGPHLFLAGGACWVASLATLWMGKLPLWCPS